MEEGGAALLDGLASDLDIFAVPHLPPTGITFTLPNSLKAAGSPVELMGTPTLSSTRVSVLVCTKRPGGLDALLQRCVRERARAQEQVA